MAAAGLVSGGGACRYRPRGHGRKKRRAAESRETKEGRLGKRLAVVAVGAASRMLLPGARPAGSSGCSVQLQHDGCGSWP